MSEKLLYIEAFLRHLTFKQINLLAAVEYQNSLTILTLCSSVEVYGRSGIRDPGL